MAVMADALKNAEADLLAAMKPSERAEYRKAVRLFLRNEVE